MSDVAGLMINYSDKSTHGRTHLKQMLVENLLSRVSSPVDWRNAGIKSVISDDDCLNVAAILKETLGGLALLGGGRYCRYWSGVLLRSCYTLKHIKTSWRRQLFDCVTNT